MLTFRPNSRSYFIYAVSKSTKIGKVEISAKCEIFIHEKLFHISIKVVRMFVEDSASNTLDLHYSLEQLVPKPFGRVSKVQSFHFYILKYKFPRIQVNRSINGNSLKII